jgi:hypothetical protein
MSKARKILFPLACLAAVGVLLTFSIHSREPRYRNRPLSYWVAALAGPRAQGPESKEAPAAVNSVGSNAVPFLLKWIPYEPPPWRPVADRLLRSSPRMPEERSEREFLAWGADRAFWILGTRAVSALPELVRMMNDPSRPETARRAAGTLRAFRTNSLPALLTVVDNPNHPCRTAAILALQIMRRDFGPALEPALPHLIQSLSPTNGTSIPGWAARALGEFKSAPQLVVPALTGCFSRPDKYLRTSCAEALARIGAPAANALPALTNVLVDPDPEVSKAASNAILSITAMGTTNAPTQ